MSRQTRREQNKLRDRSLISNDVSNYVSSSESMITDLSENDVSEIAKFIIEFMEEDLGRVNDIGIIDHVWSRETRKKMINGGTTPYCQNSGMFTRLYSKVCERILSTSLLHIDSIVSYLTVLTTEAMTKEFQSMLAYVKFLNMTLFKENGIYRIASTDIQTQVKRWVNVQQNFQARWGIYIQMPSPGLDHSSNVPSS